MVCGTPTRSAEQLAFLKPASDSAVCFLRGVTQASTPVMNCAISGEVPKEPVVSLKSGHVYEKALILKTIEHSGRCPVTGEDLEPTDLLEVKGNPIVRPRPPAAASVPGLIKIFQSEWDALMLETYTLKEHLHATRQQLAKQMYEHDAACRVIARLIKERDEAKK